MCILTQIRRGSTKIHLFGTGVLLFLLLVISVSCSGVWAVNSAQTTQSEHFNHHLTKVYENPGSYSENTFRKKEAQIVNPLLDKPPNYKVVSITEPSSYDPILPITTIDGNTDFNDTAFNLGFPGDGSPDKPYSIDNKSITGLAGNEILIDIRNTDVYFNITNCLLQNGGRGIYLENVSHGYIYSNTIFNNSYYGIRQDQSENNRLFFNTVRNGSSKGIHVSSSNNTVVSNNYVYNNDDEGMLIEKSRNCTYADNIIYNNSYPGGLVIDDSRNCTFTDNIIYNNYYGIKCSLSENNSIKNNVIFNNYYGIYMVDSENCTLSNLTIYNNKGRGINLRGCGNCEMNNINSTGNNISTDDNQANYIAASGNSTFSEITSSENYGGGIYFVDSGNSTFSEITSSENSGTGFYIRYSGNSVLSDIFTFENDGNGIYLDDSKHISIHNIKTISNKYTGLGVTYSNNHTFTNINSSFNHGSGISFNNVHNSTISNSDIYNNSINGIHLDDSKNNTLDTNIVYNNGNSSNHQREYGIYLHYYSNECKVTSNSVFSNEEGIHISNVEDSLISNNYIYDNAGNGIHLDSSAGNIISNNIVYHNRGIGIYGYYWIEPGDPIPENNIIKLNDFIGNNYLELSFYQSDCSGSNYQIDHNFWDNYRFPNNDGDDYVDYPLKVGDTGTYGEDQYHYDDYPLTEPTNDYSSIHYLTSPIITSPTSWDSANPEEWLQTRINGTVTIQWLEPLDTDDHTVTYSLYYKQQGFWEEQNWTEIISGLTTTSYDWDTTNLIDGQYNLMINATCSHGLISFYMEEGGQFEINNSPPILSDAYASPSPFLLILVSIITLGIINRYKRNL